jgi:hypothetical protein
VIHAELNEVMSATWVDKALIEQYVNQWADRYRDWAFRSQLLRLVSP